MRTYGLYDENGSEPSPACLLGSDGLAWDTETSGVSRVKDKPYGVAACVNDETAYWFPIDHPAIKVLAQDLVIGHNVKFDIMMLRKTGITMPTVPIDTMIASHMVGRLHHNLQYLSMVDLGETHKTYEDIGKTFEGMSLDDMAKFSGIHAIHTRRLWGVYRKKLKMLGSYDLFMNTEMPLVPILADMERAGVAVDSQRIIELGDYFRGRQAELIEKLNTLTNRKGVNYNAPQQIASILYEDLKLPVTKVTKKEKRPSVDARELEQFRDKFPFIDVYLQYKSYSTLISGYSDSLLKDITDGRVYGSFNQTGTVTGRLSSSGPNLQKIPTRTAEGKKIRTAFIAPEGFLLLKVDANQLELRMGGICSEDSAIINAYLSGRDMHDETAIRVFGSISKRREAKNLNFKVQYGGGSGPEVTRFKKAYPGYQAWVDRIHRFALEEGFIRTLGGRVRVLGDVHRASGYLLKHLLNEAVNTVVQGTSAEVIKRAMARADKALAGSGTLLVLQVHDEMVYQVPIRELKEVINALAEALPSREFVIPLTFDFEIGKNWGEMTEIRMEDFR